MTIIRFILPAQAYPPLSVSSPSVIAMAVAGLRQLLLRHKPLG